MEVEKRCINRVETWAKRSTIEQAKTAHHAKQSMNDVEELQMDHPLREAKRKIMAGKSILTVRKRQWRRLEEESKGADNSTRRQIIRVVDKNGQYKHNFLRFLIDAKVDPALKRAMLRWAIYKFPVRYKLKREEAE